MGEELNQEAVAELFTRHRAQLLRMVEFRLDCRVAQRLDAGDVVQEAFLTAVQRLPYLAEGLNVPPIVWLRQVVEQTLVGIHRRHLGTQQRALDRECSLEALKLGQTTSVSLAAVLAGDASTPSHAALREERRVLLEQALDQMDPVDREVLVLRHFEELGNGEVAEILGLQPTAASNRYVRALQRLKEIVESISALVPPQRAN
jgi:RNA polymerase sigma-70 factor (ECF subfamily)